MQEGLSQFKFHTEGVDTMTHPNFKDHKEAINYWSAALRNIDVKINTEIEKNPQLLVLFKERAIIKETINHNKRCLDNK